MAARLCLGATATDTGGSIRQPAAFTGTVGIKPTYGRCSRWGIVAFALVARPGRPITRTVRDSAIMLRSMAGYDPKDSTSFNVPVPDYEASIGASVAGKVIGIPKEYRIDGMPAEIDALWAQGIAWLKAAGARIVDISLPHTKYALPAYYIVAPAEASSNLARYDGVRFGLRMPGRDIAEMYGNTRQAGFGREVRRRVMIGTYVLSAGYYDAYYLRAQKVRTLVKRDFETAFADGVDAILTPATPSAAFAIGEKGGGDPIEMYLNDAFTVTVNMAGLPGIAVPAGSSAEGLPLGLQLIGRPFEEDTLFALGEVLERSAPSVELPAAGGRSEGGGDGRDRIETHPRRDRRLGDRRRDGDPRPGHLALEAVLRRRGRLRRRAEQPGVLRRRRHAGHAAGDQRGLRRAGGADGARPQGPDQPPLGVRPQELLLSGPAAGLPDLAVQAPDRRRG